jgi:hypothetical protein
MVVAFDLSEENAADLYKAETGEAPDTRYQIVAVSTESVGRKSMLLRR